MKKNQIVIAITLAVNSSALISGMGQARADEVLAKNTLQTLPGIMYQEPQKPVSRHLTGEELLARGMARLTTAKTPSDYRAAYHFFDVAAHKGVAEAQYQLALMQLDNDYVKGNEDTAIHWLQEAVLQGHQQAAITLNWVTTAGDAVC